MKRNGVRSNRRSKSEPDAIIRYRSNFVTSESLRRSAGGKTGVTQRPTGSAIAPLQDWVRRGDSKGLRPPLCEKAPPFGPFPTFSPFARQWKVGAFPLSKRRSRGSPLCLSLGTLDKPGPAPASKSDDPMAR